MKPLNPYQGQAPAAMAQMGQGISQAGGAIGEMLMKGYAGLGEGLSRGINSAVSQYVQELQAQKEQERKLELMRTQASLRLAQTGVDFGNQSALQQMQDQAAAARQGTGLQSQFDLEQLRQKYRAQQGAGGVNFGLEPFGTGGNSGAGYYNQMFGE